MATSFATAIFWVAAACCLIAQIAIVRSALVAPLNDGSETGLRRPKRAMEVLWTLVPAVGLALLLYFTWRAIQLPHLSAAAAAGLSRAARWATWSAT